MFPGLYVFAGEQWDNDSPNIESKIAFNIVAEPDAKKITIESDTDIKKNSGKM